MRGSLFACLLCEPSTFKTTSAHCVFLSVAEISVPRPLCNAFLTNRHYYKPGSRAVIQRGDPLYLVWRGEVGKGGGKRGCNQSLPSTINLFVSGFTFRIQSRNVLGRWQRILCTIVLLCYSLLSLS